MAAVHKGQLHTGASQSDSECGANAFMRGINMFEPEFDSSITIYYKNYFLFPLSVLPCFKHTTIRYKISTQEWEGRSKGQGC